MSATSMSSAPPSPSFITSFIRWLRLKNYQYEVTFAVYMLTPTEKFIFNTVVLGILSLFFMAAYVYLPNHVALIYGRIHYYFTADVSMIKDYIPSANSILQGANGPATGALNAVYETVGEAAASTAAAFDEL